MPPSISGVVRERLFYNDGDIMFKELILLVHSGLGNSIRLISKLPVPVLFDEDGKVLWSAPDVKLFPVTLSSAGGGTQP